ncbi:hypothetical protein [Rhizobium sp. NFR07]|uniref:hypothetical protein n=1 Tax=Rhizobium sp. NFR07 TaxID=1566262 RepID=UPI000B88575D|nr:hypothetical protein [Rhizobium sp. NFR07]
MTMFLLSSARSAALSVFAIVHRNRHAEDHAPILPNGWVTFSSARELDDYMLSDIGLSDGVYRRPRDDRFD